MTLKLFILDGKPEVNFNLYDIETRRTEGRKLSSSRNSNETRIHNLSSECQRNQEKPNKWEDG